MYRPIDQRALTAEAHRIVVDLLESYGNVLSPMHTGALLHLVDTFAFYCTGNPRGRRAMSLPTGMGKTTAIVGFLAALHRLDCQVPVAVASSRVEALCRLKRDLIAQGIPGQLIGLKHSDPTATEPSTGDESRLFQLVTHARVRSGRDFDLFGKHLGQRRPLCIYDESLMRADTVAIGELDLRSAFELLKVRMESRSDPLAVGLVAYVSEAVGMIVSALVEARDDSESKDNGMRVNLPALEPGTIEHYVRLTGSEARHLGAWGPQLASLLMVSQEPLHVLPTEGGGGLVSVREAVPSDLRDVVILDASTPIRALARLDPTIADGENISPAELKSFEALQIHQLLAAGGRWAIEASYRTRDPAVSREVRDIIKDKDNADANAFLIFTFLPRYGQPDVLGKLKADLTAAGIDLDQKTEDDRPRFSFLTWGNQEGLNGYEQCDVVIMAGVIQRSPLDIAASIRGQLGHLAEPTPSSVLRETIESEVAHVIYQGASRGRCRRIDQGKALSMKLFFIHKNKGMKALLDPVLSGAKWFYPEPKHLQRAVADGMVDQLLGQVVAYLQKLPLDVTSRSTRRLKEDLGVESTEAMKRSFSRAVALLAPEDHGWALNDRSVIRMTNQYGFVDQSS